MPGRYGVAALAASLALLAGACSGEGAETTSVTDLAGSTSPAGDTPPASPPSVVDEGSVPAGPEPVRIGVIMATSGRLAPHDGPVLDSLAYASAQFNASGGLEGRPLELLFENSDSELNTSYRAASRLIEQDVTVIFTTCDPFFSRPVLEVAGRAGVPAIVPCGPEPPLRVGMDPNLIFSVGTPAAEVGRAMAEVAAGAGVTTVATLVERDKSDAVEMCSAFDQAFRRLGGSSGFAFAFDRHWLAAQPVVGARATARALEGLSRFPLVVMCAATGGRGPEMFAMLRSAGVQTEVLAPAALDGVAWHAGVFGLEPLVVITEASTFGDDPSAQVNAYFASLLTGDRRPAAPDAGADARGAAEVADRVGWAVTGAEALWVFIRSAQRTASLDPAVLAADIERFEGVELWGDSASFAPRSHVIGGRSLRVVRHDGGAARLVGLLTTETGPPTNGP